MPTLFRLCVVIAALGLVPLGLAGCASPPPVASSQYCDDYARTQGPIYSRGGPRAVRDSNVLRLPGQKPVMLGGYFGNELVARFDQEDALRTYCMQYLNPPA